MNPGKTYRIKLRFMLPKHTSHVCGAVVIVLCMAGVLAMLLKPATASLPADQAPASSLPSAAIPTYYLTNGTFDGDEATTACAAGYHMASMWEIRDPSALRYDTALGYATDDSGSGPPSRSAWIRTGYASNASINDGAGMVNCNAWTSDSASDWGTYVYLNDTWSSAYADSYWLATMGLCTNELPVWCMQDRQNWETYIPLVLRQ